MEKSRLKFDRNKDRQDLSFFTSTNNYFPTQSNTKTINMQNTQYDSKNLYTYEVVNTDPGIRKFGDDENLKRDLINIQTKHNINKLKELNKKEQLKKHKQHFKLFKKDNNSENNTETNFFPKGVSRNNVEFSGVGSLDMKNLDNFKSTNSGKYENIRKIQNSTVSPVSSPLEIKNKNFNMTFKEGSVTSANTKFFNKTFQERFLTLKPEKKISEGQNLKTLNIFNINKNSTGENFYTSRSNFNKTNYTNQTGYSTFSSQKPAKLTEEDKDEIISIYHFTKHGVADSKHQNKNVLSRDEKKEIMNKFEIKPLKSEKEEEILETYLETNHSEKTEWQRTWNKFNRTEYSANPYFFKDPYKSLKKLKQNGQIFEKLFNEQVGQQVEVYSKEYLEKMREKALINKMPKVRQLKKSRTNIGSLINTLPDNNANQAINIISNEKGERLSNLDSLQGLQGSSTVNNMEKLAKAVNQENINTMQQNIQVSKKISREQLLEKVELYVNYESFSTKNKPNARNQFSITLIDNSLYLFGGINSERLSDMWICNLKDFKWKSISLDEDDSPVPRAGHSAIAFKKDIYIYGGSTPREYFKPREEILIFSPSMNKFYSEKPNNKNDIYWRRNHVAVRVGTSMFVHGGIDENEKTLSDFIVYDLVRSYWMKLECKGEKSPAIAYHSAELVCEWDRESNLNFNIYKTPENKGIPKKIRIEGIYMFGGVDEQGIFSNELRILKIGKRPCEWVNPKVTGKPPIGRINASMNFYQHLKILIIHGGRNDKDYRAVLNDIFIFDLINFSWIRAETNPSPLERTEHCSFITKDTLIIFGGNNGKHFNNFEFCVVSLDLVTCYEINRLGLNKRSSSKLIYTERKESPKFNKSLLQPSNRFSQLNNAQILAGERLNTVPKNNNENFIAGSILKIALGNKNQFNLNLKPATENENLTNEEKEQNKSVRSNNSNNISQSKVTESREETQNSQRFSKRENTLISAGIKSNLKYK